MAVITLVGYSCDRCGYRWAPRKEGVRSVLCPNCKSAYWDQGPKKVARIST